jgi:hypothetical protein
MWGNIPTTGYEPHSFFSMGRNQIPSFLSKDHDLYSQLQTSSQNIFFEALPRRKRRGDCVSS